MSVAPSGLAASGLGLDLERGVDGSAAGAADSGDVGGATEAPAAILGGGVLPADDGSAEADAHETEGAALLREWPRQVSWRRQRATNAVLWFNVSSYIPCGIIILHMFDAQHAHFSYPFLFGGTMYVAMGFLLFAYPVPPVFWKRISAFRGAAPAAAQLKRAQTAEGLMAVLSTTVTAVLYALFTMSDLGPHGGAHATPTLQAAATVLYCSTEGLSTLHFAGVGGGGTCTYPMLIAPETALQLLLAVVTKFADAVEAGMPVAALEEGLLELRELMAMLHGCMLVTIVTFLGFAVWTVSAVVVCVLEPEPPAYFVVLAITMFWLMFFVPLTAARIDAQLRRIPVALSVRACRAGIRHRAGARAANHWRVDSDLDSGGARQRVNPPAADGHEPEVAVATEEAEAAGALDGLQMRIEKMRLGWYVMGTPVTQSLMARSRAVTTAALLLAARSAAGL